MQQIKLYTPANDLLLSTDVDDSSYRLREIMGDNRLGLQFSLPEFIDIPEQSFCIFKEELYWMPRSLDYTKQHSQHFNYNLAMEGSTWMLKATKFKFFDYILENNNIRPTSSFKLSFPLTATPRMIADLIIANLKLKYPQYPWQVGDCIDSEPVTLDFNHDYCFDVLPKVVDGFDTEWELDKFTLHFRKVERLDDNGKKVSFKLSYGYNNGILGGLRRIQYDNKKIINRVYVEGVERNIDRSTYARDRNESGSDTLLLPKSKRITHEGIEYTTDASGSYLERVNPLAGEEDSLDIKKHYPKRVGTVSDVEMIDDKQGFYNIIDASIPDDLDYSKLIIAGETMTVIFQTGQLAGKEFDAKYKHDTRKFELVPIEQNGLIYPQGNIVPAVGDKYAVFHMRMPEQYITNAENEALQDVVKYLWENEQAQYSYRWNLDGIYANRNWGEIRGYLNIGYFVEFSDPQFLPDPVDVRIVAVKEKVNDPKSPEITIANNVSSKTFGAIINEIPTLEETVNRKDKEVVSYVKRGFKQSQETMQKIIESMLDFDGAIKPIAVQTMMMLIGDESLQFRYVDKRDNPQQKPSGIHYNATDKRLVCPVGIMQHMTLGINSLSSNHKDSEYKFWDCKAYQSDVLTDPRKSYFLYLKCPKSDYSNAVYLISEDAIKMEAVADHYHFLVGILNTEDENDNRSFIEMFGFTEITPARMLTQLITSADGNFVINLVQGLLEIFNNGQSMIKLDGQDGSGHLAGGNLLWDALGNLLLSNATIELRNNISEIVSKLDGTTGAAMFGKGSIMLAPDGSASFGNGNNVLKANGSGHLAKNSISWDDLGNLLVTGKYRSRTIGNRFEIDPENESLMLYNAMNNISARLWFSENIALLQFFLGTDTNVSVNALGIQLMGRANLLLDYDNMPTSDPKFKGMIWRNGTDIRISAG